MAIVFKDFGTAYLAAPLAVGGLTITVDSPSSLPVLQAGDYFYLVLQKYSDRSYVEIVKVTATAGSTYTIQRGQAGTVARAFALGDYAELRLTVAALSEFIAQGIATKMDKSGGGDFTGLYRFLSSNTSRIDIVRTSDSIASSVMLDFSASEGHRAIIGGPVGSNVATPNILLRPNGYGNGTGQVKVDKDGLVDAVALVMRGATQRTEAGAAVRYDELDKFVPKTRTVNGHDLTADFSITADEAFAAGATVNRNARFQASDFQYRQADGAYGLRFAVSSAIAYLQGGKTDSTADQKMYLTGWMGTPLSSFKVYAENPLIRRAAGVDYPLYDALNKPAIADVTGLADALLQAGGKPVLSADWVQLRSAMWNGFVAADGQTLNRADYPDAWAAIAAGKVPVVSDADWLADPLKRGSFTAGNGTTTFRVPDYNGKAVGSLGAPFMRGDGTNSAGTNGLLQGDTIRNIKGTSHPSVLNIAGSGNKVANGPFAENIQVTAGNLAFGSQFVVNYYSGGLDFDASRTVPTGPENRPLSVTGCWAIKLFGAVQNAGSIDAAGLATQIAVLQSPRPVNSINWGGAIGHRNLIINGDFRVWQRGIVDDAAAFDKYIADRWRVSCNTGARVFLTPEASRMLGKASAEMSLVGKAAGSNVYMYQRVEDSMCWGLRGKRATISFTAKSSAPLDLNVFLYRAPAYNDWVAAPVLVANPLFKLTSTVRRYTFTTDVLDGDKAAFGLQLMFNSLIGTNTIQITEVQMEVGESDTMFEQRPSGYELQLCLRYYNGLLAAGGATPFTKQLTWQSAPYFFPVVMRASPTISVISENTLGDAAGLTRNSKADCFFYSFSNGALGVVEAKLAFSAEL